MRRTFVTHEEGAAAVEFALVLPVALLFLWGMFMAGLGLWYSNLLKDVAFEASRCLAVGGPSCTTNASTTCSQTAATCFIIELGKDRGLGDLVSQEITIDQSDVSSGVASTSVTIAYPFSILGYDLTLSQRASFPNF